ARARLGEREEALTLRDHPTAAADRADDRRRPRLGTGPVTGVTRNLEADRDLRLDALERVLEGEVHLHLDVGPTPAPGLGAHPARASAEHAAEQIAQVAEIAEVEALGRVPVEPAAGSTRPAVRRPERVVLLPLVGIGERVVRVLDLLEALLGVLVTLIRVR